MSKHDLRIFAEYELDRKQFNFFRPKLFHEMRRHFYKNAKIRPKPRIRQILDKLVDIKSKSLTSRPASSLTRNESVVTTALSKKSKPFINAGIGFLHRNFLKGKKCEEKVTNSLHEIRRKLKENGCSKAISAEVLLKEFRNSCKSSRKDARKISAIDFNAKSGSILNEKPVENNNHHHPGVNSSVNYTNTCTSSIVIHHKSNNSQLKTKIDQMRDVQKRTLSVLKHVQTIENELPSVKKARSCQKSCWKDSKETNSKEIAVEEDLQSLQGSKFFDVVSGGQFRPRPIDSVSTLLEKYSLQVWQRLYSTKDPLRDQGVRALNLWNESCSAWRDATNVENSNRNEEMCENSSDSDSALAAFEVNSEILSFVDQLELQLSGNRRRTSLDQTQSPNGTIHVSI